MGEVGDFFGIVSLGSGIPILAQDWSLLGEVLDFCDRRSCETASELLTFGQTLLGMLLLSFCIRGHEGGTD